MKHRVSVYLGLGTNIGDRIAHLRAATKTLRSEVEIEKLSGVYETAPVGIIEQPPFLNLVLLGSTGLDATELLRFVKECEREVGRTPTYRWGPRVIDIDILLYGHQTIAQPGLSVPHPELLKRAFVLVPLCEIEPQVRLPDGTAICEGPLTETREHQSVGLVGPLMP